MMTGPSCALEIESTGALLATKESMSGVGVHGSESKSLASLIRGMGQTGMIGIAAAEGMAENGWLYASANEDFGLFCWMGKGTPVVIVREFT